MIRIILFLVTWAILQIPASASFVLADVEERYVFLAPLVEVRQDAKPKYDDGFGSPGYRLFLKDIWYNCDFPIDRFWLAVRLDSDSLCTGGAVRITDQYLKKLSMVPSRRMVLVEVLKTKGSDRYFVSYLSVLDSDTEIRKAWLVDSGREKNARYWDLWHTSAGCNDDIAVNINPPRALPSETWEQYSERLAQESKKTLRMLVPKATGIIHQVRYR